MRGAFAGLAAACGFGGAAARGALGVDAAGFGAPLGFGAAMGIAAVGLAAVAEAAAGLGATAGLATAAGFAAAGFAAPAGFGTVAGFGAGATGMVAVCGLGLASVRFGFLGARGSPGSSAAILRFGEGAAEAAVGGTKLARELAPAANER